MTPVQAAKIIGCNPRHVRAMIAAGNLVARRRSIPGGFVYRITREEAERVRDDPPTQGWPRGVARRKK